MICYADKVGKTIRSKQRQNIRHLKRSELLGLSQSGESPEVIVPSQPFDFSSEAVQNYRKHIHLWPQIYRERLAEQCLHLIEHQINNSGESQLSAQQLSGLIVEITSSNMTAFSENTKNGFFITVRDWYLRGLATPNVPLRSDFCYIIGNLLIEMSAQSVFTELIGTSIRVLLMVLKRQSTFNCLQQPIIEKAQTSEWLLRCITSLLNKESIFESLRLNQSESASTMSLLGVTLNQTLDVINSLWQQFQLSKATLAGLLIALINIPSDQGIIFLQRVFEVQANLFQKDRLCRNVCSILTALIEKGYDLTERLSSYIGHQISPLVFELMTSILRKHKNPVVRSYSENILCQWLGGALKPFETIIGQKWLAEYLILELNQANRPSLRRYMFEVQKTVGIQGMEVEGAAMDYPLAITKILSLVSELLQQEDREAIIIGFKLIFALISKENDGDVLSNLMANHFELLHVMERLYEYPDEKVQEYLDTVHEMYGFW